VRQQFTEQHVKLIATLRKDGTLATKTFSVIVPVKDGAEVDTDGDGVPNSRDAFPKDKNEWLDTDREGTGNNADLDDDNDGISDIDEIKYGFDPLDPSDGGSADADGDGVSNKDEIEAGSDPLDPHDTKKPKKYAPIIVDDMIIMVPIKQ
jgi:hypothetical protein